MGPLGKVDPVPAADRTWAKCVVLAVVEGEFWAYGPVYNDETVAELRASVLARHGHVLAVAPLIHAEMPEQAGPAQGGGS